MVAAMAFKCLKVFSKSLGAYVAQRWVSSPRWQDNALEDINMFLQWVATAPSTLPSTLHGYAKQYAMLIFKIKELAQHLEFWRWKWTVKVSNK